MTMTHAPDLLLGIAFAATLFVSGCFAPEDSTRVLADDFSESFSLVEFGEQEFAEGTVAFLLEIGPSPKTVVHVWHDYLRGGFGSSPDFAANLLVPAETLQSEFDLRPSEVPEPATPCEWSHLYRSVKGHGTAHALSVTAGESGMYINPNDDSPDRWAEVHPPSNRCDSGKPLEPGLHWWIFSSSSSQVVEFSIENARLVDGPIELGLAEMKVFTNGDFASDGSVSTLPVPGTGAFATLDAAAVTPSSGPAYVFSQVFQHDSGMPTFRLLDPGGAEVDMRQKVYAVEGAFVGPAGVVAPLTVVQADILHPAAGDWRAEIDTSAGTRMEFILYVVDLAVLQER